ncbi:MAG: ABC transporter ATP-binding protein [Candidatus Riflebacteria bacterium]|nr:ABC transporter ATP-binding protein [Candidatus Riflebacteria bacterium]
MKDVRRSFGSRSVLTGLNLEVPEGSVYAFLGRNASGKTTTARILLGLIRPDCGRVQVLGRDPWRAAATLAEEVGFVSDDRPFYGWMTIDEVLRFTASFYRRWDWTLVNDLTTRLGLKGGSLVHTLSRGTLAKLALATALGHRPRLLVLDEPTSGLDPVVRRQFLEQTIDLVAAEGRTVLFSSHLIDEVERVADRVGIIHEGRLIVEGTLDEVKESFCKIRALFDREVDGLTLQAPALGVRALGREVTLVAQGLADLAAGELRRLGARQVEVLGLTLEEIFIARTAGDEALP